MRANSNEEGVLLGRSMRKAALFLIGSVLMFLGLFMLLPGPLEEGTGFVVIGPLILGVGRGLPSWLTILWFLFALSMIFLFFFIRALSGGRS